MGHYWHQLFLEERPSIGLSFFRIVVALTVGLHVFPSFFHLADNYYASALKTLNGSFFPPAFLQGVGQSPDWLVRVFVGIFLLSWIGFLIGWRTQISAIVLTGSCYYFYALNSFHIGTLSWDILLVTLVLMCVTPYGGDYFSVDALRRGNPESYKHLRPFFIQRLLQIQIASTYFYTALYKITAEGNWLTGNPLHALMNNPSQGVIKNFLFKEWLGAHPQVCYGIGLGIVLTELLMPFLLFCQRTRRSGIILGVIFHVVLLLTMDVPAIFFFLFPAQLLLFINPRLVVCWVEDKQLINAQSPRVKVVYDGQCGFCRAAIQLLKVMDMFKRLEYVNLHEVELSHLHPALSHRSAISQMHVIEADGRLSGGYYAFRRLCWYLPMLYPLIAIVYLPGAGPIGQWKYRFIAHHRFLFHSNTTCKDNSCLR